MDIIVKRLTDLQNAIENIDISSLYHAVAVISATAYKGGTIYVCGNGGSAATASHLKNDLEKFACMHSDVRLKVVCLNDNVPIMTAVANDIFYNDIFSFQIEKRLQPNDLLIAISTSGNSLNVIRAVNCAHEQNVDVIGMTGGDGGKLKSIANICLHTDIKGAENIEDIHSIMCHTIAKVLSENLK